MDECKLQLKKLGDGEWRHLCRPLMVRMTKYIEKTVGTQLNNTGRPKKSASTAIKTLTTVSKGQ